MLIPLKKKYRSAHKGTHRGGEKPAPKKHRVKIGHIKHAALYGEPPIVFLHVDGRTGKGVFVKQAANS
jgi:hypothetical protein